MIWGCIGYNYKSNLVLIEGNLNSEAYIYLLEDHKIFNDIDSCKRKGNYFFQQDGATSHHFFIKRSPKMVEIRYKTLKNMKKLPAIFSILPQLIHLLKT